MYWKGCGRKWLWHDLKYLLREVKKVAWNFSQDRWSRGRNLSLGTPV
jgi:hypothetical protein